MNKILSLLLLSAILIAVVPHAHGLGTPEAPAGITADHWIPMGEAAGFVITDTANDLRKGLRTDRNVVTGYFMVRRGRSWMRVEPGSDPGVYPTRLTG
jgi:hypothetical protein